MRLFRTNILSFTEGVDLSVIGLLELEVVRKVHRKKVKFILKLLSEPISFFRKLFSYFLALILWASIIVIYISF